MENVLNILTQYSTYITIGLIVLVLIQFILLIVALRSLSKVENKFRKIMRGVVGSDLSFSVALLDGENNGVILTGIYGRDYSTTYAKPIDKGISRYDLSEEELHVLNAAMNK
ncbi:MAG: DUF4446 family protein [Clostridium perfringens]|nr:DUF4446 family protein [Clostridium perfringens]